MRLFHGLSHRLFQSTPPAWVATALAYMFGPQYAISIHATRVGGDIPFRILIPSNSISIHATRVGGDHDSGVMDNHDAPFQSTPPAWVATLTVCPVLICLCHFNPRHPRGWRLVQHRWAILCKAISIHATRVGGD